MRSYVRIDSSLEGYDWVAEKDTPRQPSTHRLIYFTSAGGDNEDKATRGMG